MKCRTDIGSLETHSVTWHGKVPALCMETKHWVSHPWSLFAENPSFCHPRLQQVFLFTLAYAVAYMINSNINDYEMRAKQTKRVKCISRQFASQIYYFGFCFFIELGWIVHIRSERKACISKFILYYSITLESIVLFVCFLWFFLQYFLSKPFDWSHL